MLGYCDNKFRDPILRIERVLDARTKRRIPRVTLTHISLGGQPVLTPTWLNLNSVAYNATGDATRLVCDVACGFGFIPGMYQFTVAAPGYRPRIVEVPARYQRITGPGCPVYSEGSTVLVMVLDPN